MKGSVRITVDILKRLYRQAAAGGHSIRKLVLAGVRIALIEDRRLRSEVRFPLIVSEGPKVDLTNDQVFEHIEFPWCQYLLALLWNPLRIQKSNARCQVF